MDENLERPNYFAVIPATVRYADVTANAKLLYAEITALSNKTGTCWASNKYFADLYGVNVDAVSKWIKQLVDAGFVSTKINKSAGNRRYLRITEVPIMNNHYTYNEKSFVNNNKTNKTTYVKLEKDLLALANKVLGREFRVLPERGVKKTLDAFSLVEIEMALTALARDKWHREKIKELKLDYFIRSTTIDKFLAIAKKDGTVPITEGIEDSTVAAGGIFPAKWPKGQAEWSEDDDENRYFRGIKIDHTNQDEIMRIEKERLGGTK